MSDHGATAGFFAGLKRSDILIAVCPAIGRSTSEVSKQAMSNQSDGFCIH